VKKPTKAELEQENARLKAEIEGYKAALKFMQDMAKLTQPVTVPVTVPVYIPAPAPVYPDPFPWWQPSITWCDTNTADAPRLTTTSSIEVW